MTRKDYVLLAHALGLAVVRAPDKPSDSGCRACARAAALLAAEYVADALQLANPAFDRARFMAAVTTTKG